MKKIKACLLSFGILISAGVVSGDNVPPLKPIVGHYIENRKEVPVWNKEVCGAFKRYLDSFPPQDSYRGCGLKPSSTVTDITFPEWKKIDPLKNADIVKKMDDYTFSNRYPAELKRLTNRQYVQRMVGMDPSYSLYVNNIDVDNDGKPEIVYRIDYLVSSCPSNGEMDSPPVPRMIAFDEAGEVNKRVSNFLNVVSNYVFFYRGKTYRTLWGKSGVGKKANTGVTVSGWNGGECYFDYATH